MWQLAIIHDRVTDFHVVGRRGLLKGLRIMMNLDDFFICECGQMLYAVRPEDEIAIQGRIYEMPDAGYISASVVDSD